MWLKLRQIALIAEKLEPVEQQLCNTLAINVCYRDPGVSYYGLENALMPIGNQLLEVVAPTEEGTAGGRYLERRGGDGGYMVITQCDEHAPRVARIKELGVRTVTFHEGAEFRNMQLHPKDTGGSFFEIDEQLGADAHADDGPWHPAGPDWQSAKNSERVTSIAAAELQCDDPAKVANHWGDIAQLPVAADLSIELANATLRFVPCRDGRPEGLGAIDLQCSARDQILAAANAIGVVTGESQISLCGIRMNLL